MDCDEDCGSRSDLDGVVAGAVLLITLLITLGANAGRFLVVDAPERSDVILVLAGETEHRPARALELAGSGLRAQRDDRRSGGGDDLQF